jgi:hypothetical protein
MRIPIMAVLLAACAGDAPPATGRCTGELYDSCNTEDDCNSTLCQNFAAEGFQVCSQACDETMACPDEGVCDDLTGACLPAGPNECEL